MNSCSSPVVSFAEKATSLSQIQQAHAHMLKTGIFQETYAASKLIAFAAMKPDPITVSYAHSILSHMENPNSFCCNSIMRAYANTSTPQDALFLFRRMLGGCPVYPDNYSFTFALKACALFAGLQEGRQIHGIVLKTGFGSDVFVVNTLIHVFAQNGCFETAREVLGRMHERDAVSWNALLSAYVENGLMGLAEELFDEMEERNVESWNFMISGYVNAMEVEKARDFFDRMPMKNVVSWNAIMTGYAHASLYSEVLEHLREMLCLEVRPDSCTLVNVLSACAHLGALRQGEWAHTYIDKHGIEIDGFLATALVDMYSKCGSIDKALGVFRAASRKDVSTWNSMISGLSIHGFGKEALEIFSEMLLEGCEPNSVTFISVLSACSHAGLLDKGREIFDLMVRVYGIEPTVKHYGCMADLLGRMGLLEEAEELVKKMPPEQETSVVLESLLGACKSHGDMALAERVAERLLEENPQDAAGYVQISNLYASGGRWSEVIEVRRKMRAERVAKVPGCSMIEVNGTVHEFLAGEGVILKEI